MIRYPAVAGTFYDADPQVLRKSIDACFLGRYGPGSLPSVARAGSRRIVGLVAPHAGYRYSGFGAASAYAELASDGLPDVAVIIGPNHHGIGARAAIMSSGTWRTPLGEVEIDAEIASAAMRACDILREDDRAHLLEHSLEVQVPFLQYLSPGIRIVPIVLSLMSWEDANLCATSIGGAVAEAIRGRNAIVIASTDLTHEQPKTIAERQDREAIAAIQRLDSDGLLDVVEKKGITMCGVVPTAAAIMACRALGAESAHLLSYYTSGDIIGDVSRVVGYGALKITKTTEMSDE